MRKYQYKILRYVHDHISNEFVNVGIVLYDPTTKFLCAKTISRYSRLSNFFLDVKGHEVISYLKAFVNNVNNVANSFNELFAHNYTDLDEVMSEVMRKDDFSIVYTETKYCIDVQPDIALEDAFNRYVNKYINEVDREVQNDIKVWRKVYKKFFDKYKITDNLTTHTVRTSHDSIEFDKAWKNGHWNCFQSLSFNLKRSDAVKNKVYKWSGILGELETSDQDIHLYLLTSIPHADKKLNKFISDSLTKHESQSLKVTLVHEEEAENLAKKVKLQMDNHLA